VETISHSYEFYSTPTILLHPLTFENLDVFSHPVYLRGIRIKFVYTFHRVIVKVTGGKKVENPYFRYVKLPLAITPVLSNI